MKKQTILPKTGNESFVYTVHAPSGAIYTEVRKLKTIPEILTRHMRTSEELLANWTCAGWKYESAFLLDFRMLDIDSMEVSPLMF